MGIGFGFGEWAAERAFTKQKKILKNQIQWRTADMRAAGLNPILAVSPGAATAATAPMGKGASGDSLVSSAKSLSKAKSELEILQNTAEKTSSDAETAKNLVFKSGADALVSEETALQERMNTQLQQTGQATALAGKTLKDRTLGALMRGLGHDAAPFDANVNSRIKRRRKR